MPDNDIELRSEEVQDILTRIPCWTIRWGNLAILILLLLLLTLSWIIRYPDIITAEVIITTDTPPEKLIARSSGRLEKILVENQQKIVKGTPLAVIENTSDYQDVFRLKSITDTLVIGDNFKFPFEKLRKLQLGDIAPAFAVFEKEYIAYSLNRDLHPYAIEGNALQGEHYELRQRLTLLTEQREIAGEELQIKKQELQRFKKLHEKGVIATQEYDTKQLEYLQFEKGLRNLNTSISQLRSSLNELSKNKKTVRLNQTKDQVVLFRNAIQSYSQLKKAIADWELSFVLRASVAGKVSYLQVWKENQTVTQGDNIFTVIPIGAGSYVGKIRAVAQNSGKLKSGQTVNIHLANYPDREFGTLKGTVQSISLIPDKEGYLLIDVSLPEKLLTSYRKEIVFRQEMSGTADVVTEDLRLLERLLYQFREAFGRNTEAPKTESESESEV